MDFFLKLEQFQICVMPCQRMRNDFNKIFFKHLTLQIIKKQTYHYHMCNSRTYLGYVAHLCYFSIGNNCKASYIFKFI